MPNMTTPTQATDPWELTKTSDTIPNAGVITLGTKGKYLDKDIQIPIATGSVTMTKGNGALSGTNITLSDTNSSGVSITGSGSVSATAKTTAGYTPANNSYATGSSTASNGKTQYVTKVTLGNSKSFQIQDPIYTWTWTVDANGNVTIT